MVLDEDLVRLPRQLLRAEVVPTEAGQRAVPPREAGSARRMVGDAAAENVTDEGLDRVRLGERHAGNPIGVPLRRATLAGLGHEQRRVRFGDERLDLLKVAAQTPLGLGGRTVAESRPDDPGRRTEQEGMAAELTVLDTMVKPCCLANAQTAESSAAVRPTART